AGQGAARGNSNPARRRASRPPLAKTPVDVSATFMHSTRTALLAMLVVLLLPAPAVLAETAPPDRSKTAGPISAELAKKCTPRDVQSPRPPTTALSKKLHSLPLSIRRYNST